MKVGSLYYDFINLQGLDISFAKREKLVTFLILIYVFAAFLPAMVNSFIHVLMYSYYGLAALGSSVSKYLWWKKYLTILQLIQFTTALILGINGIRSGCDFPLWMQYALVIYMISFIVLFGNFYAKAYIAKVSSDFDYSRVQKVTPHLIIFLHFTTIIL